MRILHGIFKVCITISIILLAVSFVRIVITGDTTKIFTFTPFMEALGNFDYDFGKLLNSIIGLFDKITVSLSELGRLFGGLWSGNTALAKIVSLFTTFYNLFKGLVEFIVGFFTAFADVIKEFGKFLKAIVDLFTELFGAGWIQ